METEALNGQGISYLEEGEGMLFVHYIGKWTPITMYKLEKIL